MKSWIKNVLKASPIIGNWISQLNNENFRNEFVKYQLEGIEPGLKLLDAGCGSQQYKKYAGHTEYYGQDFAKYVSDDKKMLGCETGGMCKNAENEDGGYAYGDLAYVCDIWDIDEQPCTFDVILCTEVFEHIPYPHETLREFSRLLKPGGKLILTAPNCCLRHMDPYYFYTGFSDRWYEYFLTKYGFDIELIEPVGDYYSWLKVEMARSFRHNNLIAKFALFPALIFFSLKRANKVSKDTLCEGYHIVGKKL